MVWAVSLLTVKLISHGLTGSWNPCQIFGVCHDLVPLSQPAPKQLLYPLTGRHRRCASTHFGEIQLALNSIGISPLITAHRLIFQHQYVRSSDGYYPSFNLAMIRSSRFGSIRSDSRCADRPIQTRFRLGSEIFSLLTLPLPISRRLILQQARGQTRHPPTACQLTVSCSFSLPSGGSLSPFRRRTSSLSVTQEYLALRGGPR